MIWLPAVMFACLWLVRENRPRLAALYAVAPGILITVHYLFLHSAGAMGLLGLGTALWYSAVCITVLWLCPTESSGVNVCLHTAPDYRFCSSANDPIQREAASSLGAGRVKAQSPSEQCSAHPALALEVPASRPL